MAEFFKSIGRFFKRIGFVIAKFFVLTIEEMKKVRWPTREKMKEASKIVLTFVFLFGLYIVLDDWLIAQILKLIKY